MLEIEKLSSEIGEYQRDYLFHVSVVTIPTALPTAYPDAQTVANSLDLLVQSTPVPDTKTKGIKLMWSGMFGWWAGPNDSSGTVQWTFMVPKSWNVADFFEAWHDLNMDPDTGAANPKPACVGTVMISSVDLDKTNVLKQYQLKRFNVLAVDAMEFKKDGADMQKIKITGHYESRVKVTPSGTQI